MKNADKKASVMMTSFLSAKNLTHSRIKKKKKKKKKKMKEQQNAM